MKLTTTALCVATLLAVACIPAGIARGDDTETLIREIIKGARTDAERSARLMEAVSLAEDNKKLRLVLLEKAIDYGIKGLRTLEDCTRLQNALTVLAKEDPERKPHWLSHKAVVLRRMCTLTKSLPAKKQLATTLVDLLIEVGNGYASKGEWKKALAAYTNARSTAKTFRLPNSDKLAGFIRSSSYLHQVRDKIDTYVEALKKSPDDTETRTNLVTTLLTVMDDPAAAAGHVNADLDERLQTFIPLAAKDAAQVPVVGCKSLADWYSKELSKSSVPIVKFRMLSRARAYYRQVLERHGKADLTTTAAKLAIGRIESDIAKLGRVDPLVCSYCGATGRMPCGSCLVDGKSIGLRACYSCKGKGVGKCQTCGGIWGRTCSRCSGKGKVSSGTQRRGGVIYKLYSPCYTCKGKGKTHRSRYGSTRSGPCPTCSKRLPVSARGTGTCTRCGGKGGTSECSTCRGSKTAFCTYCKTGRSAKAAHRDSSKSSRRSYRDRSRPPRPDSSKSSKESD